MIPRQTRRYKRRFFGICVILVCFRVTIRMEFRMTNPAQINVYVNEHSSEIPIPMGFHRFDTHVVIRRVYSVRLPSQEIRVSGPNILADWYWLEKGVRSSRGRLHVGFYRLPDTFCYLQTLKLRRQVQTILLTGICRTQI